MGEVITGETILQAAMRRGKFGLVLANAEIGAIAAGTVTSVLHLRNANWGTDHFLGQAVYRPGNATGVADYVRYGTSLTTAGVLSIDANWADTTLGTENVYIFDLKITPTQFLDALNRALLRCYFDNVEPLSTKPAGTVVADAGFQSTATSSYTESDADGGAATTFTKVTTTNSENVFMGLGAGRILNGAAGGYIRQRYPVTEGEQVTVYNLTRLDSGTNSELVLYDVSNSAAIGTTVEHDQESHQIMKRSEAMPSTCKILEVRHQGEGASDDIYINGVWVYKNRALRMILDTTWETEFNMPSLAYLALRGPGTGGANVYDAHAAKWEPIPKDDYEFLIERPGANPYAIQFETDEWFQYPIIIQGRRAYADLTTFTLALTETTAAPLELIEAATRMEMFGRSGCYPDAARYQAASDDFQDQRGKHRHTAGVKKESYYVRGLRS